MTVPVIKQSDQREQTHLLIDAVIPVKVSSLPGKNMDVNVLKMYKKEKVNVIISSCIFRLDSDDLMKPNYSMMVPAGLFFRGS